MKTNLTNIWEMRIHLSTATPEPVVDALRSRVREAVDRELMGSVVPSPFLWTTRGAVLIMWTEGSPFPLMEVSEWALMNCDPSIRGFELEAKRVAPLRRMEGWQGYGRD